MVFIIYKHCNHVKFVIWYCDIDTYFGEYYMVELDSFICKWLFIMSFRRKWVSDTNLSKLLHETIEKREANKQSRLPDFCKDAILGATIKKISSALVLDGANDSGLKGKLALEELSDKSNAINPVFDELCPSIQSIDKSWDDESGVDVSLHMNVDEIEDKVLDDEMINHERLRYSDNKKQSQNEQTQCPSPKRKRQPSAEGVDGLSTEVNLVSSRSSPLKKRREDGCDKNKSDGDFIELNVCTKGSGRSGLLYSKSRSSNHLAFEQYRTQRSQSLPHLTSFVNHDNNLLIPTKSNFTSSKSVVNSISELSIQDCWEGTNDNATWCLTKNEVTDSDPLELNGFFQELKSVTVQPN